MTFTIQNRYAGLDALKCICALMIVCLHTIPYSYAPLLIALCRIAVPIFFMITGFFYPCHDNSRQNRQIRKVIKLCVISFFIYSVYYTIMDVKVGNNVTNWLTASLGYDSILDFLFFNQIKGIEHLWYLYALLYALLIIRFLRLDKLNIYLLIGTLSFLLSLGYAISFLDFPYWYYRNWLFEGIAFILLGMSIRRCCSVCNKNALVLSFIIGVLLLPLELSLSEAFLRGQKEYYLSTLFVVVPVFIYGVRTPMANLGVLSNIGKNYSSSIYIYHILVLRVSSFWIQYDTIRNIAPIVVFVLTLISIYTFNKFVYFLASRRLTVK